MDTRPPNSVNAYEEERSQRIERNRAAMVQLGLASAAAPFRFSPEGGRHHRARIT
jgi:hypothetical protein